MAQSIQGTATYEERKALPPAAVFEALLEDVSRADAPAEIVASTRIASPGNPPINFTITYDPGKILPKHRYVVRARILLDEKPLFVTDTASPVLTAGSASKLSLMMRPVGGGQTPPPTWRPPAKRRIGERSNVRGDSSAARHACGHPGRAWPTTRQPPQHGSHHRFKVAVSTPTITTAANIEE
jgi:putative lipoprotein